MTVAGVWASSGAAGDVEPEGSSKEMTEAPLSSSSQSSLMDPGRLVGMSVVVLAMLMFLEMIF